MRFILSWFLLSACECFATADGGPAPAEVKPAAQAAPPEGLHEGWERNVRLPRSPEKGRRTLQEARFTLWVEKGWLIVRRTAADGVLDWQIVLARASDPMPPEVEVDETKGTFDVRYGPYFIRESSPFGARLRVFRERKSEQSPEWPIAEVPDGLQTVSRTRVPGIFHATGTANYWFWVQSGIALGRPDVCIRLCPNTERPIDTTGGRGGRGGAYAVGGPIETKRGDSFSQDEGDLLVANRASLELNASGLSGATLRDWLKANDRTDDPKPITAREWLNAEGKPLLLDGPLRGKVVLLQFVSTGIPSTLRGLARCEELHRKYASQGLEVIGIDAGDKTAPRDVALNALRAAGVTFPVMIDREDPAREAPPRRDPLPPGETARRYLVDTLPACFLLDRSGKLVEGFAMTPPDDSSIEQLLGLAAGPTPAKK